MNDYDFGDAAPEDAWDDGDPPETKLGILERVIAALRALHKVPLERRDDALRLVAKLERAHEGDPERLADIRAALEDLR